MIFYHLLIMIMMIIGGISYNRIHMTMNVSTVYIANIISDDFSHGILTIIMIIVFLIWRTYIYL